MSTSVKKEEAIATLKSGPVSINVFKKSGDYGHYLDSGQLSYLYKDSAGETRYSEYLRSQHWLHGAFCLLQAHILQVTWQACSSSKTNMISTILDWAKHSPAEEASDFEMNTVKLPPPY